MAKDMGNPEGMDHTGNSGDRNSLMGNLTGHLTDMVRGAGEYVMGKGKETVSTGMAAGAAKKLSGRGKQLEQQLKDAGAD